MSRKKPLGRGAASTPPENPRTTGGPGQTPRRRKGWLSAGLITALAAVCLTAVWIRNRGASVPPIDLTGLDPSVAQAIQRQLDAVRTQPSSGSAWGNLGALLHAYHLLEPARVCLSEAGRLDSHNPRWPYFQSLLLATTAPEEALAKLRRAVELCGNDPEALRLRLAMLLTEAGSWAEAGNEIQELLKAKPDFAPALLLSARRAQARGDISEAIRLTQRCADDPRTARAAALFLASAYARQGDPGAASNAVRRASSLPQDEPVANPFQAEVALLRDDPRILAERAHPLLAAGRLADAEALVKRLLEQHPNYGESWLLAGRLQILKKDYPTAEKHLRRHLELEPQSSQGWFQLGAAHLNQARFAEAAETFLKASQLKPDYGPAFYNRGYALARTGKLREAIPMFREAIRLNPERIDSYMMLADVSLRLGEKEEAEKMLLQAELLNPSYPGLRQLRMKAQQTGNRRSL